MDEKEQKSISFLQDWSQNYFKSRDAFKKEIISIEKIDMGIIIIFKDRKERIICMPDLSNLNNYDLSGNITIITLNNKLNIEKLYTLWKKFITFSSLKIYFINPFSSLDKKWIISPQVHAKICDDSSLKTGFKSMFETVEELTEESLISKL